MDTIVETVAAIAHEGAHAVAYRALTNAVKRAEDARAILGKAGARKGKLLSPAARRQFGEDLAQLAKQFLETAREVKKLVRPALDYLSGVLDAQLAIAAEDTGAGNFEPLRYTKVRLR